MEEGSRQVKALRTLIPKTHMKSPMRGTNLQYQLPRSESKAERRNMESSHVPHLEHTAWQKQKTLAKSDKTSSVPVCGRRNRALGSKLERPGDTILICPVPDPRTVRGWTQLLAKTRHTAMANAQVPFSFPLAHFLIFVFVTSTIIHLQQRIVKIPPLSEMPTVTEMPGSGEMPGRSQLQGMFTINSIGRLGNQMGEYATLFALARMNGRPAFIPAAMHSALAPIFRISLPVLHGDTDRRIPWQNYHLNDWMEERYRHIPGRYVRLTGYPCSWTFYHHLRPEILQEFTLHDHVREEAQAFLRGLRVNGSQPSTFVGVHVRRGDYVHVMPNVWKGVVADRGYLKQALDRFRARYPSPVFVVTSNGMAWCRENIDASQGDVVFAGNGIEGSPAKDFALLTQCNHTIMTIGTFGIWAAYLAGGDTIYLANYTLPDSPFLKIFKPEAAFLPEWVGIPADLSPLLKH